MGPELGQVSGPGGYGCGGGGPVVGSRHAKVLGSSPATPHSVLISRFAGSALGKLPGGMTYFN